MFGLFAFKYMAYVLLIGTPFPIKYFFLPLTLVFLGTSIIFSYSFKAQEDELLKRLVKPIFIVLIIFCGLITIN